MHNDEKVSITISIAKANRDKLRFMANEPNLKDPDQITSASTVALEAFLKKSLKKEDIKNDDE